MKWRATPLADDADSSEDAATPDGIGLSFLDAATNGGSQRERIKTDIKKELLVLAKKSAAANAANANNIEGLWAIDPLAFFRDNLASFPRLAPLARSLFSLQATSADSERGFSRAGINDTALRSGLSPAKLEAATMMRSASLAGVPLRDAVTKLLQAKKKAANKKRSLTQLENAAKKSRLAVSTDDSNDAVDSTPPTAAAEGGAVAPAAAAVDAADDTAEAVVIDDDADIEVEFDDAGGMPHEDIAPEEPPELDEFSEPLQLADFAEYEY